MAAHRKRSLASHSTDSLEKGDPSLEENTAKTEGRRSNGLQQLALTLVLFCIFLFAVYHERHETLGPIPVATELSEGQRISLELNGGRDGDLDPPHSADDDDDDGDKAHIQAAGDDDDDGGKVHIQAAAARHDDVYGSEKVIHHHAAAGSDLIDIKVNGQDGDHVAPAAALAPPEQQPLVHERLNNPVAGVLIAPDLDSLEVLEQTVATMTKDVSDLKRVRRLNMENDPEAQVAIHELQAKCRELVVRKYGPEPYLLELKLAFPESMPDYSEKGAEGTVRIEMAPVDEMPYSVLTFLNMITTEWTGGAFHRNAHHVKQVTTNGRHPGFPLAFQEYSPNFPHKKHTLGFAGRPSSDAFYVSTVDNTRNHGPGSQGHKTEADACFAKLVGEESIATIDRLELQPGARGGNGFVSPKSNYVEITAFSLLK